MTFGEAIAAVKKGAKISREGWNGKSQYIQIGTHVSFRLLDGTVINAGHETMGNAALVFYGTSGIQVGWLASQSDILSDDWYIKGE